MSEGSAQVNGPASPGGKYIDTINPDDPEYQRQMRRPAEIKEDLKQMDNRGRVSVVLNHDTFRSELEQIVTEYLTSGPHPANLMALQQISELLAPPNRNVGPYGRVPSPVIPINDLRGPEAQGINKNERNLRCKLAAVYRLVDLNGWSQGIYNHISARVSQEQEHFLLNPFGLLYSEVTASSLVKVDILGEVQDPGSTSLGVNKAGFVLHSAIHQARPDIKCVIHLHTPQAVAVSAMQCGLLPISQEALICGDISYHDYTGILMEQEDRDKLARNLGPSNKVMILHNHGIVACGSTIEEAYHYASNVVLACEAQVNSMPAGEDKLVRVDADIAKKAFAVGSKGGGGVDTAGRKWKPGELEFEALMRQLDNAGFRTGYLYKNPMIKQEKKDRSASEVEVPPSSSSFAYYYDGDEHGRFISPFKILERQKQAYKAGWLTSPNTYKKTEIDEIGTPNPKKITKWVSESGAATSTPPVRVEHPNLFAPQGANPKELREHHKKIKKDYYEERVTAGPQSKVLEGISWEEAQKAKDGQLSGTGDNVVVIGAASKGIIKRDHQHNAVVYKSYYAANPFENVTSEEIESYQKAVDKKAKGEPEDENEPGPDGRLISTEERMQQIQLSRSEDEEEMPSGTDIDAVNGQKRAPPEQPPTEHLTAGGAVRRTESERQPSRNPKLIEELEKKTLERSKSDRKSRGEEAGEKPGSPAKSDTMRSTDSASGGETLEERSSKEGSPTKEQPTSPTKEKKKKKKFRMPSFSKGKKKDSKESSI